MDTTLGETSLNMKYYLRVMVTPPPKEAFVYLMPEEKRYADQQQYPVAPVALHRGPSPSLMATPTSPEAPHFEACRRSDASLSRRSATIECLGRDGLLPPLFRSPIGSTVPGPAFSKQPGSR